MRVAEIRALTTPEVESRLDDAREELFKLRFQFKTGQLTDYSRLRVARRSIARLETVLRERQIAAMLAAREER
ncbi:MAG: 50S ribosomal protein L29 [Anaerolineales bacterium]